jgi:hypothetical protein
MAIYSIAQRTTSGTAATAAWEIRTTSTDRAQILELGISQVAATAGVFGFGRPGAIGVTPTSPQTILAEDPGEPAGTITVCVAWATGPTVPANFARRVSCPATVGAGVIWTFPRGYQVAVSSSAVIWVIATAPVCDVWVVLNE